MRKQGEQGGIDREQETKNFCANTGGTLKSTGLCAKPANTKAQAWHEINVGCWSETYRLLDPMNGYNPPDLSRHPYPHPAGQRAVSKLKPGPRYPLQLRVQLRYPLRYSSLSAIRLASVVSIVSWDKLLRYLSSSSIIFGRSDFFFSLITWSAKNLEKTTKRQERRPLDLLRRVAIESRHSNDKTCS